MHGYGLDRWNIGWMWMFGWSDHRFGPDIPGTQVNAVCSVCNA